MLRNICKSNSNSICKVKWIGKNSKICIKTGSNSFSILLPTLSYSVSHAPREAIFPNGSHSPSSSYCVEPPSPSSDFPRTEMSRRRRRRPSPAPPSPPTWAASAAPMSRICAAVLCRPRHPSPARPSGGRGGNGSGSVQVECLDTQNRNPT